MTIILATSTIMLADSLTTWGTLATTDPQKVRCFFGGGHLVGVSGEWGLCNAFFEWYLDQKSVAPAATQSERIDALIVKPSGMFWSDGRTGILHPIHEDVWAIGSGADVALGAIWVGATLFDAVAVACERCHSCGWPIQWYTTDGDKGMLTRDDWQHAMSLPCQVLEQLYPTGLRVAAEVDK